MFQSAPVIADGRTLEPAVADGDRELFQSAPVIADGRTLPHSGRNCNDPMFQSAPVIADGRTHVWHAITVTFFCFNPRPSSLTGEPRAREAQADKLAEVSIRARHR